MSFFIIFLKVCNNSWFSCDKEILSINKSICFFELFYIISFLGFSQFMVLVFPLLQHIFIVMDSLI